MEAALKKFFSSPRFAVAGASQDSSKFGFKVFVWYVNHDLPVTPINPRASAITLQKGASSTKHETVASPSALANAKDYSLSVITPPAVTRKLLEEAKAVGIAAVWLQPGTFDDDILQMARREWPDAAIAGTDVPGTNGGEGWCVLVDGEAGMEAAGRVGASSGRL